MIRINFLAFWRFLWRFHRLWLFSTSLNVTFILIMRIQYLAYVLLKGSWVTWGCTVFVWGGNIMGYMPVPRRPEEHRMV